MSGYKKVIKRIIDETYKPITGRLITKAKELDPDWEPGMEEDLDDDFLILEQDTVIPEAMDADADVGMEGDMMAEERRLLGLLSDTGTSLREQILGSSIDDLTKAKCLQMLREYHDDPENNSTTMTTIQLILRLPTTCMTLPISMNNSCTETTEFLNEAWLHMQSQVYGQERAKSEIIEYLVSNLLTQSAVDTPANAPADVDVGVQGTSSMPAGRPSPKTRVLGLVGAPGVGKTSLAIHGIAKVMGVPFHQISVGGLRDVTYFNGSLRCWKGAHHGVFSDILTKAGCQNPIIYIDELDKVAGESCIDIYGMLTHAVDPLTNSQIHDHYLNIDIDLSKVTFIFSYNDPDVLPEPLRDRIKEIYFEGFNDEEKVDIARDFIIPTCLNEYGISDKEISFSDDVIAYTNKSLKNPGTHAASGVRYLNKGYQSLIGKIMVNVISNTDSYEHLKHIRGQSGSRGVSITKTPPSAGGRTSRGRAKRQAKRNQRRTQLAPVYLRGNGSNGKLKTVKLPYKPKITDIDQYLH